MIQVDVFWSFAIGATFAHAASAALMKEKDRFINSYFVYTLLFLSLIFAPSGSYLLSQFPGWETMFMFTPPFHGIFPCLFSFSNVLLGIIGFYTVVQLSKQGKEFLATAAWTFGYCIMFGILGFGYRRFLYPGSLQDWKAGRNYLFVDFFSCEVFYTLLGMGVVVLPTLYYPLLYWPQRDLEKAKRVWKNYLTATFIAIVIGSLGFLAYVQMLEQRERDKLKDQELKSLGPYAPLAGFLGAEIIFGLLVAWPLLASINRSKPKTS